MPRPKANERKQWEEKKRKITIEKMRKKAFANGANKIRGSEDKIRLALGDKLLTYTELKKASGLSNNKTFRTRLKAMGEQEEIMRVATEEKKGYMLTKIRNYESLEFFAIRVLHQFLKNGLINEFNQHLGSLITYTLRNYELAQATQIITTILSEVERYIKPTLLETDQRLLLCGTPAITLKAESPEWALWKAIDSREYITTQKVPKCFSIIESKKSKLETNQIELPCSGRCVCDKVSDGCMNRLLEARLRDKTATKNVIWKTQVIEREGFDYPKFEREWGHK
jgi:hypothetical protein